MLGDQKKEEIRDAADIVEVVGDYVRLKRSGSGFTGLCPFHDEKTPSFHVNPSMGIYKCFGCGESGDVYSFVMAMEGVSFPEALRSLAERYGISLPEYDQPQDREEQHEREGIMHALRFAGLFFYRMLNELEEAEPARAYLEKRGYKRDTIRTYGLGYAPGSGSALLKAAQQEGIEEQYLLQADLVKPSTRGDGTYDTFRERLMFPIFNPSGKVIAFAGRILDDSKKTAKYVNSAQTSVYNKSEVVYGVNFAKNEIRKREEAILVEGYTDVITMHKHGIENVVASSGTSLTEAQIRLLMRYGKRLVMIYDADDAGQTAMDRGLNIALSQGMDVQLLQLPDREDPDSFVKQFGAESFLDLKKEKAHDFITYLIQKAEAQQKMNNPAERAELINSILKRIALIPDEIQRQVFVQHLHQLTQAYRKGSDRELFQQLEKEVAEQARSSQRRSRREHAQTRRAEPQEAPPRHPSPQPVHRKKIPNYEKEVIRLMLQYGEPMRKFVGHNISDDHFESEEMRLFYQDIIQRHVDGEEVSPEHYAHREKPFPSLLGDVLLERNALDESSKAARNSDIRKDRNPYKTAKSCLKPLRRTFLERKRLDLSGQIKQADGEEKERLNKLMVKLQREITRIQKLSADELFDDPEFLQKGSSGQPGGFSYTMKDKS
ncbi:MAG: DNA primase [Balneolaceae bacterium]